MRAIIIEDEKNGREILVKLLELHCPDILVCNTADSVAKGIKLINEYRPDVIFLDIKLGGENGFDILTKLHDKELDFKVIFTTAYEEYAIKAIKNEAVDYLLKPIDSEELKNAVSKLIKQHKSKQLIDSNNISIPNYLPQKIKIQNRSGFDLVELDSILYCHSEANYTRIYFKDKKNIITSKTLKHYQLILEKYWFLRIHKSIIINTKEVESYKHGKGGQVIMSNGEILEVGGSYKKLLIEMFSN